MTQQGKTVWFQLQKLRPAVESMAESLAKIAELLDTVPNLAGTYDLVSFSSALITGGKALEQPDVSGVLTLQPGTGRAMGTFETSISVPDGLGGTTVFDDDGTYKVGTDGTWEQAGNLNQASGAYTLDGATLTVTVTEPSLAAAVSVWQHRPQE